MKSGRRTLQVQPDTSCQIQAHPYLEALIRTSAAWPFRHAFLLTPEVHEHLPLSATRRVTSSPATRRRQRQRKALRRARDRHYTCVPQFLSGGSK